MTWYLTALISALFSAAAAVAEKKILIREKALQMASLLALFNLILAVPFFFLTDYPAVSPGAAGVLFIKSCLAAGAFFCVMQAIKNLEISRALPMLTLTPGLAALFAFILLGESLNRAEISGMLMLTAGIYLLQLKEDESLFTPPVRMMNRKGITYVFSALMIFTFTSILDKALLKNFRLPLNALFAFQHLFFAFIFLTAAGFWGGGKSALVKTFRNSGRLIFILALMTVVYRYSYLLALKSAPVALVLSLKRISVFFAVIAGGVYFRDRNLPLRAAATAVMIAGAVLIIVN